MSALIRVTARWIRLLTSDYLTPPPTSILTTIYSPPSHTTYQREALSTAEFWYESIHGGAPWAHAPISGLISFGQDTRKEPTHGD